MLVVGTGGSPSDETAQVRVADTAGLSRVSRLLFVLTSAGAAASGAGALVWVWILVPGPIGRVAAVALVMAWAVLVIRFARGLAAERDALRQEVIDLRRLTTRASAPPEVKRRIHEILDAAEAMRMAYQPIVHLEDGAVVGYEALARFEDGRPPNEWFAEAGAAGLGGEFELAAVAKALGQQPPGGGYLSVNVGPATLAGDALREALGNLPGRAVVLELTEHDVIEDYDHVTAAVLRLRNDRVLVAVDDAGSGVSTLRHIVRLRPDIVKLDRWLIDHLDEDASRQALARSVVAFSDEVGIVLVAEGIEREEERGVCIDLGIRYGQGYLLGRPVLAEPASADLRGPIT